MTRAAEADNVDLTQEKDVTIAVITHGEGDSFWAVAKKGAEQAGKDLGVTVKYSESANDPQEQAQLIEAAVTEEVDGIAVSAPDPDAIQDSVKTAIDAGIPVITLNSGAEESADLGAITHVGQTETIAGEGAGAQAQGGRRHQDHLHHPRAGQRRPQPALRRRQEGLRRRGREPAGGRRQRHLDDADRDPVQARVRHVDRRRAVAQPGHRGRRARRGRGRRLGGDGSARSTCPAT